jgi:hypothetical protein
MADDLNVNGVLQILFVWTNQLAGGAVCYRVIAKHKLGQRQ